MLQFYLQSVSEEAKPYVSNEDFARRQRQFPELRTALRKVYSALKDEPQTRNEIAYRIDLNQKTVQGALLELVRTKKNIKWKKIGGYRIFWKV
jgi:hypothetical protein